ncbi:MAG TPA: cytochrome c oxidase assembly protein [Gemmatimonadales bacterium]
MLTRMRLPALLLLLAAVPTAAAAHEGKPPAPHDLAGAWPTDPGVLAPLLGAMVLYLLGVRRLRERAGGAAFRGRVPLFVAGWLVLAVALATPLHALGSALFSAHMLQHELVMAVAAPLLVLGRPLAPMLFALPEGWRRPVGLVAARGPGGALAGFLANPLVATLLHAAAVLFWHVPPFYEATLTSEAAHAAQHASFLLTALVFWWALLRGNARPKRGAAVIALFATTVYTGGLGALLTVSETPWYTAYGNAALPWGLTPLEDQQLAGIIMWMPGAGPYLVAALLLISGWIRDGGSRAVRRAAVAGVLLLAGTGGCHLDGEDAGYTAARLTGGDPARGAVQVRRHGCGSCHTIGGIPGADGLVGPPLDGIAARGFIGGVLPNSGENLVRWIQDPKAAAPRTAMPDLGVTESEARDIAAYLYTLSD